MADYEVDEMESLMDAMEDYESDESDESDFSEAPKRWRAPRTPSVRTAPGVVQPRAVERGKYVTQAELQSALSGVARQIRTNSDAIKTVNGGIKALGKDQARLEALLKKEAAQRKKDMGTLQNNLQMAMLMPVLMQKTITVGAVAPGSTTVTGSVNAVAPEGTLTMLLPMLLMGGMGGSMGFGGSSDDNNNMNMMLLVLALSGGLSG